jgi:hypothetical protein
LVARPQRVRKGHPERKIDGEIAKKHHGSKWVLITAFNEADSLDNSWSKNANSDARIHNHQQ